MATANGQAHAHGDSSMPLSSKRKAYPEAHFDTQLLRTDPEPVTFASSSATKSTLEPLRSARIATCGPETRASLSTASQAIRSNLPVAFPTETVYGLAANALSTDACKSIFDAKGRPQDNPLIVHVSDIEMAQSITKAGWVAPPAYQVLIRRFWPGGITFLVPASRPTNPQADDGYDHRVESTTSSDGDWVPFKGTGTSHLPLMVTANHPLVGIRMPSHSLARALIAETQLPLAAPSANASGRPSPTTAEHVMYDLGGALDEHLQPTTTSPKGRIPCILDGGSSESGVESTVVDGVTNPNELRILRPGAISAEQIQECLYANGQEDIQLRVYGKDLARQSTFEENPTTPGMKYRHYSPTAPVVLLVVKEGSDKAWKEVMMEQVEMLRQAKEIQRPIKVGILSLLDSPLTTQIYSHTPPSQELTNWLQSESTSTTSTKASIGPSIPFNSTITLHPFSLGSSKDPKMAAHRLFSGLRILDQEPVDLIFIEAIHEVDIGLAVMNRVRKAAGLTAYISP
ncbi:unnamed protein product [Sympodiomycopsis kandeliae]